MDCGKKPSKNNELRKNKIKRTKLCTVKLTNKWDQIGPQKRIAQRLYKAESIRILAKGKSMFMVGNWVRFIRILDKRRGAPLRFART